MTKKIIHINRNIIQQNEKHGRKLPVCRIDMDGKTWYGSRILQILAWMWCVVFGIAVGSWTVFGGAIGMGLLMGVWVFGDIILGAIFMFTGYHSNRSRGAIWVDGKKINLPKGDPGGEHE